MRESEYEFWAHPERAAFEPDVQKLTKDVYEELLKNKDNLPGDNRQLGKLTIIKNVDGSGYNFARWENGFGDALTAAPLDASEQILIKAFADPDFLFLHPKTNEPVFRDDDSNPYKGMWLKK